MESIEDLKNRLSIHRNYSKFNIETKDDTIYIKLESNKTLIERRKGLN